MLFPTQVEVSCPKEMAWKVNMYRGYLAICHPEEQQLSFIERLVEMASSLAIREWRRLPHVVSHVHTPLLQVGPVLVVCGGFSEGGASPGGEGALPGGRGTFSRGERGLFWGGPFPGGGGLFSGGSFSRGGGPFSTGSLPAEPLPSRLRAVSGAGRQRKLSPCPPAICTRAR